METIEHNGMTFVKATAVAKKYRYTTDYIGQLCRSGKVEAKLIGRAWFVNEASLTHHKSDRYSSPRSNEIIINKAVLSHSASDTLPVRREIRPVLSKNTHRAFSQNVHPEPVVRPTAVAHVAVHYNQDSGHLHPYLERPARTQERIQPQTPPRVLKAKVKPQPEPEPEVEYAVPVVLGEKAVHKLPFESLPEVPLRGNLTIDSLDDPRLYTPVEPVSQAGIAEVSAVAEIDEEAAPSGVSKSVMVAHKYQPLVKPRVSQLAHSGHQAVEVGSVTVPSFTPTSVRPGRASFSVATSARPVGAASVFFVPLLALVSLTLVLSLFGLSSYAKTDGLQFEESVHFSVAAVVESVNFLLQSY